MNNYIVTIIFNAERIDCPIQADYSIDAINTVIDDLFYDHLDSLTGSMTIICKLEGKS